MIAGVSGVGYRQDMMMSYKLIFIAFIFVLSGCIGWKQYPHPINDYTNLSTEEQHRVFESLPIPDQMGALIWDNENNHHIDFTLWDIFARNGNDNFPYIISHLKSLDNRLGYWLYMWLDHLREYQQDNQLSCDSKIVITLENTIRRQKDSWFRDTWFRDARYLFSRLKKDCYTANKNRHWKNRSQAHVFPVL